MATDDLDELAAHLVDDGTLRAEDEICCPGYCGKPVAGICPRCGAHRCEGGLFMHKMIGCGTLEPMQERSDGDGE